MTDIETVINSLRVCLNPKTCDGCSYKSTTSTPCMSILKKDALRLLVEMNKKQSYATETKPARLMHLEEVIQKPEGVVWLEVNYAHSVKLVPIEILDVCTDGIRSAFCEKKFIDYNKSSYGWRVWTGKPTDEQMEETLWISK